MKRDKFNLVLLLCFCTGSLSNPVEENITEVDLYTYKGHIDTTTSASDESLARWTISADVQITRKFRSDFIIIQLEDIKTSLFNGNRSNLHNTHEKEITEEVKILEQPFVLKWDNDDRVRASLLLKPNEPLWSVNLKKGVANLLNFDYEKPYETSDGKIADLKGPMPYSIRENTIYGKCMVKYSRKSASVQDGVVYEKKMDKLDCEQQAINHSTNTVKAPGVKDMFDIIDFNQIKLLTLKKGSRFWRTKKLESKSDFSYKTSPSATYTQQVHQEQSFKYRQTFATVEPTDISECTERRELIYEFGDDLTSGRHINEKDSVKLKKQFLEHYDELNKVFKFSAEESSVRSSDSVYDMYNTLLHMDVDGLRSIEKDIIEKKVDGDFELFYYSMLPYIGTNATVEYLTNFYKSDLISANEEMAARVLVTFPKYILEPSDDKLVEMEGILSNPNAKKKISKHAAVLGFASAVATSCKNDAISKKYKHKYIDMFHRKYLDGQTYEDKMVYILGLANIAECLDFDFMNSITTNSSDYEDFRAFAINGFKNILSNYENTDKVYETYWPLVQKKSEPFKVRVAALELLLSSPLNEEQFNIIVQKYSGDLNEPEDKHLANYLLSTLHSIQNTTGYHDHLGALASEAIKNANIHRLPRDLATGKYRLSTTDAVPNTGTAFEARLISDVKTNLPHTIEISFNNFGNSFDFGTYTLHLSFSGFYKQLVERKKPKSEELSPESSPESYLEIILFVNNIAVYTRHWDHIEEGEMNELLKELGDFLSNSKQFTFHVNDDVHIPSDLGTPIIISNYITDVSRKNNDKYLYHKSLLSSQTWIKAYNPLADANIASYKCYNDEKNIKLNVTFHKKFPPSLTWTNENNTYSKIWDNNMGVTIKEGDKLKEYCEKCEILNEVDMSQWSSWISSFEPFGFYFDFESYNHDRSNERGKVLQELWTQNLHRYNVDALPYAGPVLFVTNLINYDYWLRSDLSKGSIRTRPTTTEWDESTVTTWNTVLISGTTNQFNFRSLVEFNSDITVRNLEGKVLSFVNLTANYTNYHADFETENSTELTETQLTFVNFIYKPLNANNSFKICGRRNTDFPIFRDDRLSIKPYEDTVGETVFIFARNVDDFEDCVPEYTCTLKEIYSSIDKKSNMDSKISKDYEKCTADSKDLKYTAPTTECQRVSNRFTEYDNYQVYLTAVKHLEDRNETITEEKPIFEYYRISEDKLRVNFTGLTNYFLKEPETMSYEVYYPKMTVNPLWLSFSTDESSIIEYAHSTCIITPSTVEKFSGKLVPNQRKEWLAFSECVNVTRSLNGHTIDDKHVGFTFNSSEFVLVATVKNSHLDVTLNGKKITKYHAEEDTFLIINFLGENAIYVNDFYAEIYYNTEYVFIRTEPLYPNFDCGLCN